MIKLFSKIKIALASLLLFSAFGITLVPIHTSALTGDASKAQICDSIGAGNCSSGGVSISSIMKVVIILISYLVGFVAVIMIILGGYKYITSGGDSSKITSAKNSIVYAIVGLVIVALAQFVVQFVIARASQQPVPVTTAAPTGNLPPVAPLNCPAGNHDQKCPH